MRRERPAHTHDLCFFVLGYVLGRVRKGHGVGLGEEGDVGG